MRTVSALTNGAELSARGKTGSPLCGTDSGSIWVLTSSSLSPHTQGVEKSGHAADSGARFHCAAVSSTVIRFQLFPFLSTPGHFRSCLFTTISFTDACYPASPLHTIVVRWACIECRQSFRRPTYHEREPVRTDFSMLKERNFDASATT